MRIRKRTATDAIPIPEHEVKERAAQGIFGVTTLQLALLWYGGLAVVAALVMVPESPGAWHLAAAIAIVTILALYTFSPSVKARKGWAILAVLGAVLLATVFHVGRHAYAGWMDAAAERRATSLVKLDEVEVADLVAEAPYYAWNPPTLAGTIRNRSSHTLLAVTLEFTATDDGEVIDRGSVTVHKVVPPGEARQFPPAGQGGLAVPLERTTLQGAGADYGWSYVPPVKHLGSDLDFSFLDVESGSDRPTTAVNPSGFDSFKPDYDVEVRLTGTRGR